MTLPLGVVLAGGRATRMGGGDKCLLDLGGRPILDHVLERLAPQVASVAINANGPADRFRQFDCPVLPDGVPGFPGPLAGVLAGLDWAAQEGVETIVTVAGDTPFFPQDLVARLTEAAVGQSPVLASTDGRHPTFGLWPVALREDLRQALVEGVRKVVLWTDKHGATTAQFQVSGRDPFFNINTPEDLAEAVQAV